MKSDSSSRQGLTRRGFLAQMGLASVAAAAVARSSLAAEAPAQTQPSAAPAPSGWETVRKAFLLREGIAYLNNGTLGPCPRAVVDEMTRVARQIEGNPAEEAFGPLLEKADNVRQKAAELLGCSKEEIALTRNTTDGMNTVAQGLDLRPGDRVLTTDHEHPGGSVCWEHYAKRSRIQIEKVKLPLTPASADDLVRLFEAKLTREVKVISVSHVTFTTGLRLPIRRIRALADQAGAILVVDGAQGPGALRVNVRELGCHAYATSAHKWLLAPKGTGILYISDAVKDRVTPLLLHSGRQVYTASAGTPNLPAIMGLGAAIDFLSGIGLEKVEARSLQLRRAICDDLRQIQGVSVVSADAAELASPLVTFALPDAVDNSAFAHALRDKHGVIVKVVPRDFVNGIRVSAHVYNSEEDVERLLGAVRKELG